MRQARCNALNQRETGIAWRKRNVLYEAQGGDTIFPGVVRCAVALEDELVGARELDGQPAFLMSDSPNPSDDLRSDAIIASVAGRVVRLEKDEYLVGAGGSTVLTSSATYGVGFTRFNEDWANQQVGFRETPEYVRVETRPGEATPRPPEARRHTFEIMNLRAQVQTPTGAFDCIEVKRTKDWEAEEDGGDASDADAKTFWFARGVGKVQERNDVTGSTEVLTSYEIPGSP